MRIPIVIIALLFSALAWSAEPPCTDSWIKKTQECDDGGTQNMTRCFGAKRQEADDELNDIYGQLKADLVDPRVFVKAQRSWIAYRDAECTYQSSGYACDSGISGMCSLSSGLCQIRLTCERVKLLREHIDTKCNGCPVRKSDG
jgi:uncharacterized protein YecT (DUF1311 family)